MKVHPLELSNARLFRLDGILICWTAQVEA